MVDNASTDGTCAEVRRRGIGLIANEGNCGFAAAVNQGVRYLDKPFILLLNPDAVLQSGLPALRARCQARGVGAAGGNLTGPDGRPQAGFVVRRLPGAAALIAEALLWNRLWPGNPINWHYRCLDLDLTRPQPVEQPAGAFLMFRRDVWERAGGFDESYWPLWFEDVDFCSRIRDLGYAVYYEPTAVARHTGGHSIRKISVENRQLYWYGGFLRYAARHLPRPRARMVAAAVVLGSVLRLIGDLTRGRGLKRAKAYGNVIKLAFHYLCAR